MITAEEFGKDLPLDKREALLALSDDCEEWATAKDLGVGGRVLYYLYIGDVKKVCDQRWSDKKGCNEYSITPFGLEVKEALKRMEERGG